MWTRPLVTRLAAVWGVLCCELSLIPLWTHVADSDDDDDDDDEGPDLKFNPMKEMLRD